MKRQNVRQLFVEAKEKGYALPAINVSNMDTVIAALEGLEEAKSPGILQVTIGSARAASRTGDPVEGAIVLGRMINELKKQYTVPIIVHTDHCHVQYVDIWLKPLLKRLIQIKHDTGEKIFDSFMFDGSMADIHANAAVIAELAPLVKKIDGFLEVEAGGRWGGSEDGVGGGAKYSTSDDVRVIQNAMHDNDWDEHDYLLAIAFGNAHGTSVKANLKAELLSEIGLETHEDNLYVFHGGSGSSLDDIRAAVRNGVVKMNVDTDTQFAFTKGVMDYLDGAPMVDGGSADAHVMVPAYRSHKSGKKYFDPRAWNSAGRSEMTRRVIEVARDLRSEGRNGTER